MYAPVQLPEEQMKRLFLLCSLVALAACAQPAPPPPQAAAPPPPPPPPEHNFTVFFDWDRANITPEGQQIVEAAAATYKSEPPVPVQVIGHTDTSGSAAYNQKLSVRRAQNVASALTQAGVPQNAMTVTGVGQNDLKVPTPDGVREPQNRRTEIIEGGAPEAAPPPPPPPPAPGS
jgi:OmpA-OmpF porin, OOP family